MGCISSAPADNTAVVPPTQNEAPAGLVGLENTAVHGAALINGQQPLKRKITLILKAIKTAEEDLEIAKHGIHYILAGTHAVIDVATSELVGYLEGNNFIAEANSYVKDLCSKHGLTFRSS